MKIPEIKLPRFTTKLPLTGQEIQYRPFLVKEEKILINALEQDDITNLIDAVSDIVDACTDGVITINSPMFDVQWAFLQIRGKSVGEVLEFVLVCNSCDHKQPANVRVEDFALKHQIGHKQTIDLKNGVSVTMKYPTFHHFATLFEDESPEGVYKVVSECIDKITDSEQVFVNDGSDPNGMLEWVNNLTPDQFSLLENFFTTMPVLEKTLTYTCKSCQKENIVTISGIRNFFE